MDLFGFLKKGKKDKETFEFAKASDVPDFGSDLPSLESAGAKEDMEMLPSISGPPVPPAWPGVSIRQEVAEPSPLPEFDALMREPAREARPVQHFEQAKPAFRTEPAPEQKPAEVQPARQAGEVFLEEEHCRMIVGRIDQLTREEDALKQDEKILAELIARQDSAYELLQGGLEKMEQNLNTADRVLFG